MDLAHVAEQHHLAPELITSTPFPPCNYETTKSLGVVKGASVRLRNICGDILIALNALVGGKNYLLLQLFKDTRQEAYNEMMIEAAKLGANSVINVTYDTTEIGVLCYGTACIIRPISSP
jgi:uncharacterized protein YbjQ (UPF0145 family)